jgi:hypothetical protein
MIAAAAAAADQLLGRRQGVGIRRWRNECDGLPRRNPLHNFVTEENATQE